MVLAAATWTVTVCIPSVEKVYEILPSSVISGCKHKRYRNHISEACGTTFLQYAVLYSPNVFSYLDFLGVLSEV